jgi:sensor c-di-GMP phosphodiesterase-like protein
MNNSTSATTNEKIKDIVIELHKLSNDVSDSSRKAEQLKSAIKDNQLSMRTIIAANKENMKKLNMQHVHFWILVSLIITVVAASGILYFFEKYDIGMMVAAGVLGVVLVYQAILIIIGFIKKN